MSKHYVSQEACTVTIDSLASHHRDALNAYYRNKGPKPVTYSANGSYTFPPPEPRELVLRIAEAAWAKIEIFNERIKSAENDMLKSSLRREKNIFAKEFEDYMRETHNKSHLDKDIKVYHEYYVKFMQAIENDTDLVNKHYGHLRYRNPDTHEPENQMLLEVRSVYRGLKEKINQELVDRNVDEESIAKTWQYISDKYKKHEQKCKDHESQVLNLIDRLMCCGCWHSIYGCGSFTDTPLHEDKMNKYHTTGMRHLKFASDQLIKQSIAKGLKFSGQQLEESETIVELKKLQEELKKKLDKKFVDHNIDGQIKSDVLQLFNSKYEQHSKKLKDLEQSVKQLEDTLLMYDIDQAQSISNSLKQQQKQIDNWKLESNNLIEKITNKAIELSYQVSSLQPLAQIQPIQQNDLPVQAGQEAEVAQEAANLDQAPPQPELLQPVEQPLALPSAAIQ